MKYYLLKTFLVGFAQLIIGNIILIASLKMGVPFILAFLMALYPFVLAIANWIPLFEAFNKNFISKKRQ